jgi:hypothetical protein
MLIRPSSKYGSFSKFMYLFWSGPTGIGDKIKPKNTQKVTKLLIFKTPQNTYKEAKLQNFKKCNSVLPQALVMRGLVKVYFRTLELLVDLRKYPFF